MKGIIFKHLEDMVVEQFGLVLWDDVLNQCELKSEGIYTSTLTYDDDELHKLLNQLNIATGLAVRDLVLAYAGYIFPHLYKAAPQSAREKATLKEFLKTIEHDIHVEVRKLDKNSALPTLHYDDPSDDTLIMHYSSPRKLEDLAEGLIKAAALHFDQEITLSRQPHDDIVTFTIEFK